MDLILRNARTALWNGRAWRCAIGRSGIVRDKREGDGATPAGRFAFRRVLYRPDRMARPQSALPVRPLSPDDGWCDDADDACYNRLISIVGRYGE